MIRTVDLVFYTHLGTSPHWPTCLLSAYNTSFIFTGESTSHQFRDCLISEGTLLSFSYPHAYQHNRVIERQHRHIFDIIRSFLLSAFVSLFWAEVVITSAFQINMIPAYVHASVSPYQRLYGPYSCVFDCTYFMQLPSTEGGKLSSTSVTCVFFGYSPQHKGYKCYDPLSVRICISYHVIFRECVPYYTLPRVLQSLYRHPRLRSFFLYIVIPYPFLTFLSSSYLRLSTSELYGQIKTIKSLYFTLCISFRTDPIGQALQDTGR